MLQECFRPCGPAELELVRQSGFRRWPPRLVGQPFFYPVTNEEYAREITVKWNVPADGVGYVTRFFLPVAFLENYPVQTVGAERHTEWWIPAEDLPQMNDQIAGLIEILGEYRPPVGPEPDALGALLPPARPGRLARPPPRPSPPRPLFSQAPSGRFPHARIAAGHQRDLVCKKIPGLGTTKDYLREFPMDTLALIDLSTPCRQMSR